jgi:hypothetical protein
MIKIPMGFLPKFIRSFFHHVFARVKNLFTKVHREPEKGGKRNSARVEENLFSASFTEGNGGDVAEQFQEIKTKLIVEV